MRILHVTNWFPNPSNKREALWIERHIKALSSYVNQEIFHLNVSKGFQFSLTSDRFIFRLPGLPWRIAEIISAAILFSFLVIKRAKMEYDLINFHIAYPNLVFWHFIKKWIRIPIIITEHWSAYHDNFGAKGELSRIQRIFQQNIPVIVVSKALGNDIRRFSHSDFPSYVVPNIVESRFFKRSGVARDGRIFFMVSQWKSPKKPLLAIKAIKKLSLEFSDIRLFIGGYGPQWEQIINESKDSQNIKLLGRLDPDEISDYLSRVSALIHPTGYETFSVVCAESIYAGCPVIASGVGGIVEFINADNGILVSQNTVDSFYLAIKAHLENPVQVVDTPDLSSETIGKEYYRILSAIHHGNKK